MASDASAFGVTVLPVRILTTVYLSSHLHKYYTPSVLAHTSSSPNRQRLRENLQVISRAQHFGNCNSTIFLSRRLYRREFRRSLYLNFQDLERFGRRAARSYTCRPSSTLADVLRKSDAVGLVGPGSCLQTVIVQSALLWLRKTTHVEWCTSHCPPTTLLATCTRSALSCQRSTDPGTSPLCAVFDNTVVLSSVVVVPSSRHILQCSSPLLRYQRRCSRRSCHPASP